MSSCFLNFYLVCFDLDLFSFISSTSKSFEVVIITDLYITFPYRIRSSTCSGLPFLAMYSWTGIWTSLFMALSAVFNLSSYIRYCTRFTDDCFNALLATNFLYEAGRYVTPYTRYVLISLFFNLFIIFFPL